MVPGSGTTQPRTTKSGSSRPSEDRVPAEKVIARINDLFSDWQLDPDLGWRKVAHWLRQFTADGIVDAAEWFISDCYTGAVYISEDALTSHGVFVSQLGRLADEWLKFRADHGVKSLAEYELVRDTEERGAQAAEPEASSEEVAADEPAQPEETSPTTYDFHLWSFFGETLTNASRTTRRPEPQPPEASTGRQVWLTQDEHDQCLDDEDARVHVAQERRKAA